MIQRCAKRRFILLCANNVLFEDIRNDAEALYGLYFVDGDTYDDWRNIDRRVKDFERRAARLKIRMRAWNRSSEWPADGKM